MDKEDVVHIYSGILVLKRNKTESFVETGMNLESVIQSKVSQKEKNKYCILMHMHRIYKNATDKPIYRVEIEMQT